MIEWINKQDASWEGIFRSSFFHNEENLPEMTIYIEKSSLADYAEKCVESFNNLPSSLINEICEGIIRYAKKGGINEEFKLPELKNVVDILEYCWFNTVYVETPEKKESIRYIVEGEGDWGESIGFIIENNQLAYVGVYYLE
ncbi:MAG: hypothetical protein IJ666_03815 [Ruminococcus sp.]|nr:hypothetical protein [Ruminococcus sp.]